MRNTNTTQESRIPETPIPTQTITRGPEKASVQTEFQTPLTTNHSADQSTAPAPLHAQTPIEGQTLIETIEIQEFNTPSVGEDWATPETQQEPTQQLRPLTNAQTQTMEEFPSLTQLLEDGQLQPSMHPLDGIERAFTGQDADT
ncbi:hypothetical protein OIDMADRAFT_62147 [Oidiodendron maius Zn]|uniref:Uncharacterized protein n=1 Tax=Oidiodendron maius (strain Zn) TaxID=913774 RepID=A0A0C3CT95_OIDMZ|nr:hypothetical protein OIDMADRAFT_62147 [Oidiodendron maius Zn]